MHLPPWTFYVPKKETSKEYVIPLTFLEIDNRKEYQLSFLPTLNMIRQYIKEYSFLFYWHNKKKCKKVASDKAYMRS